MKKNDCWLCPKSFQSKKDLEKHLKKIHGLSIADIKKHFNEEKSEFMEQCLGIMNKISIKKGE